MGSVELIKLVAWASLALMFILVAWQPSWRPQVALATNARSLVLFASVAMLFVFAYPDSRRVVAICAILAAVGSEVLPSVFSSRHAGMRSASVKTLSALSGVFLGAILLQFIS